MVNPSHWRLYQNGAAIGSFLEPLQLLYEESLRKIGELYPSTFSSFKYLEVFSTLGSAWIAIRTKGVSKLGNSWQIWAPQPKNRPMPDMLTSWGSIWTDAWDQMQITAGLWVQGIVSTVVETIFARICEDDCQFPISFPVGLKPHIRYCKVWWDLLCSLMIHRLQLHPRYAYTTPTAAQCARRNRFECSTSPPCEKWRKH